MATEIERKFLVTGDFPRGESTEIIQGYLNHDPERTVRVRIDSDAAWLTVKGKTEGMSRAEFEYPIPLADARAMLALTAGSAVEKARFRLPSGTHTWEIDVFHGANEGLVIAEIELRSESDAFEMPEWLGSEVTSDHRYANSSLAVKPYRDW